MGKKKKNNKTAKSRRSGRQARKKMRRKEYEAALADLQASWWPCRSG